MSILGGKFQNARSVWYHNFTGNGPFGMPSATNKSYGSNSLISEVSGDTPIDQYKELRFGDFTKTLDTSATDL